MLAVYIVHVRKKSIDETAGDLMRSPKWVRNWLNRFDSGGLNGLRDLPRSGRLSKIPSEIMERIIDKAALLNSGDLCRSLQKCVFGSSPDSILPCFITVFKSVVPSTGLFKSETSHPSTLVVNFGDQPTRIYQSRLCRQCKL